MRRTFLAVALAAAAFAAVPADAQSFNWRAQDGRTVTLLLNNHPWSQAIRQMAADFTAQTGIRTRIEIFNEEQFRTRLSTLMQGRSADIDVFMTLASREGAVFNRAGWYADLAPLIGDRALTAPDFNYEDFGEGMRRQSTVDGRVVSIPINLEGPLFYWRRDIFQRCNIAEPRAVEDIPAAAQALRACEPTMGVWAARGLRGAVNYALTGFINNLGGSYATPEGRPGLCQPATLRGIEMYASLLKDYGPPGALNHTFTQVIELLGQGRVAMVHESSNEFANIMRFPGRAQDLGVRVLPPGRETGVSRPVVIGWGLAVSSASRNREAAWTFIQWATSAEVQSRLVQAGVAPPRASVFSGPAFTAWAAELPIRRAWADALIEIGRTGTGVYQTPTDRIPEARDIIGNAVQQIVLGRASARDAACAADAELARLQ
jgi:multiple sugar transport system substrate-binding protein